MNMILSNKQWCSNWSSVSLSSTCSHTHTERERERESLHLFSLLLLLSLSSLSSLQFNQFAERWWISASVILPPGVFVLHRLPPGVFVLHRLPQLLPEIHFWWTSNWRRPGGDLSEEPPHFSSVEMEEQRLCSFSSPCLWSWAQSSWPQLRAGLEINHQVKSLWSSCFYHNMDLWLYYYCVTQQCVLTVETKDQGPLRQNQTYRYSHSYSWLSILMHACKIHLDGF